MLKLAKNFYSPEEYFEIEEAGHKGEYFHGEIFSMAGGTPDHNRLTVDFAGLLNSGFKNRNCEAFASDLRVEVDKDKHYTYPDVAVVSGELEFAEHRKDTITNPILIAEVLSDSTEDYDRGTKFALYRNIRSLRDYVLIDQKKVHIEHFFKNGGVWQLQEYFDLDESLPLRSVGVEFSVRAICHRVSFGS